MANLLEIAVILSAVDKMSSVVQQATGKSQKHLMNFSEKAAAAAATMSGLGDKALIAGGIVGAGLMHAVTAAEEGEQSVRRLNAVFEAMGDKTGVAAKKAEEFASTLSMQIGVEDDLVMATQAKLATFSQVISKTAQMNGVFDRATKLAFDMGAAGFGEATQNAVQLGKALQDPIKGINAMSKSGITFTAQEKERIRTLVESNQLHKAQEIILKAVETQVGGVAAKSATTSAKFKVAMGEMTESIGRALLPAMQKITTSLTTGVIPKVMNFIEQNPKVAQGVAIATVALIGAGIALKVLAFSINTVIGVSKILRPVIAGLSFGYKLLTSDIARARAMVMLKTITTKIATVATYAWNAANMLLSKGFSVVTGAVRLLTNVMRANPILLIIGLIAAAAFWIIENWEKVKAFFQWLWDGIKSIFNNVWGYIKDWFMKFTPVGLVIKYWDPLVKWFSNLWNRVKGTFSAFWDFLKSIPSRMFEAGKNIVKSIWEGIKSMAMKPVEAIKEIVKKIRDMLPFSPAKVGPLRDIHRIRLVETIADSVKPTSLIEKMKSVVGATMNVVAPGAKAIAVSFVGGVSPVASPVGARGASSAGVNINYSPTITMAGGSPADQSSFARLLQDHAKMLTNMINEELRKQNRTKFA